MAQKINIRASYWKNLNRVGINKSCVFFNRLPQDPKIENMNFPWELLDGEYLGFQGITDCFWNIFTEDLKFIVKKVKESNIRKLCLISKIPVNEEQIDVLETVKDKLVVCYSVTGLDLLEKTSTEERIRSLVKLRNRNIDVLPVMHPYIHNYTDAKKVFALLNKYGFKQINWKGFRYNSSNMKDLKKFIPIDILSKYESSEEEIMIGSNFLKSLAKKYNLVYCDLKEYLHRPNNCKINVNKKAITYQVDKLMKMCICSSSSTENDVREYSIKRRIQDK